jgi:hypothetical protein
MNLLFLPEEVEDISGRYPPIRNVLWNYRQVEPILDFTPIRIWWWTRSPGATQIEIKVLIFYITRRDK